MKRPFALACLVAMLVLPLGCAAQPPAEASPIRLKATRSITDIARTTLEVPGAPQHRVIQRLYTYRFDDDTHPDFAGATTRQFAHMDEFDGTGTHSGYAVWTLKDGSEIYVRFDGGHRSEGGTPPRTTFKGTLSLVGGTGRYREGTGTYWGEANATTSRMDVALDVSPPTSAD